MSQPQTRVIGRSRRQWIRRFTVLTAIALLLGGWSIAHAQSLGGSASGAASIARDAARDAEQIAANQIDRESRQRAASMINNLRAKLDACGEQGMLGLQNAANKTTVIQIPKRPALRYSPALELAASNHAVAMARQRFFDHTDPQGRTVGQRVKQIGYRWRVIDPRFTEFGLAQVNATDPADPYGSYWTLVVAQPR